MSNSTVFKFTYSPRGGKSAGREMLADTNSKIINEIFGSDVCNVVAKPMGNSSLLGKFKSLIGWLDGLDPTVAQNCINKISDNKSDIVYIEGSNYGRLVKLAKKKVPSCKIVVFFHNVESRFFWGAFKKKPSLHALGVLLANFLAERLAVIHSDAIICLTDRDSKLLYRIYGRSGDYIVPISVFNDPRCDTKLSGKVPALGQDFGIFVGGAFYANVEAVRWLAKYVAEDLSCQIYILGRGFEDYLDEFSDCKNIAVIGEVDSLNEWYRRAKFSIAPIFDGSGMKTKVAESLMFGRPILATSEAFVGYDDVHGKAGLVCNHAQEFVKSIRDIINGSVTFDEEFLKSLYKKNYSYEAAREKMRFIFSEVASENLLS
ncbi:glycosyltransferase [Marinobacter sp. LV10R520-4]|uniref:glycosyltransferase n=1 Tax=Marinobacter sp. LV10R520-4 TaxID=1761796 RepID=UPI000BF9D5BF|nr:glycosyltransferase [Marinobacter sp. LV10R520-4]